MLVLGTLQVPKLPNHPHSFIYLSIYRSSHLNMYAFISKIIVSYTFNSHLLGAVYKKYASVPGAKFPNSTNNKHFRFDTYGTF